MKIAIIGSRDYDRLDRVVKYVYSLPLDTIIVSGHARGVDTTAEVAAKEVGMETLIFPADWKKHGKVAGFIRNRDIIQNADRVVAFWDGKSHGTAHSLSIAKELGKPVEINPIV